MEEPDESPTQPRSSPDYVGAFCFVLLILTVIYAAMTTA
jgi:hypothetical protein